MFETFAILYGCFFILTCLIWIVTLWLNLHQFSQTRLMLMIFFLLLALLVQWIMTWGEILTFGLVLIAGFLSGLACLILPLYGICLIVSKIKKIQPKSTLRSMSFSFLLCSIFLLSLLNLLFFLFRIEVI